MRFYPASLLANDALSVLLRSRAGFIGSNDRFLRSSHAHGVAIRTVKRSCIAALGMQFRVGSAKRTDEFVRQLNPPFFLV
jgi:hypothetical protein